MASLRQHPLEWLLLSAAYAADFGGWLLISGFFVCAGREVSQESACVCALQSVVLWLGQHLSCLATTDVMLFEFVLYVL